MKKKLLLTAVLALGTLTGVMAQKPVVYVEYFSYSSDIGSAMAEQVRNSVMANITKTERVELIDVASVPSLQVESERRRQEAAMGDETARLGVMQQAGATHILQGYVSQIGIKKSRTEGENAHDFYSATVDYTLKVIDASTGKLSATADISLGHSMLDLSTGATPEEAVAAVLKANKKKIEDFMDEHFKLKAIVLAEEFTIDDDEIETCLVTLGADHGITKGQQLEVFCVRFIAGRETQKLIGALKVTEVMAGDISQCKVSKGGKEIKTAMDEYLKLMSEDPAHARPLVVSTKKKTGLGAKLRSINF